MQAFINAYRSQLPYDATGANPAARLTIDVAAGDRFLIDLDRKATSDWLTTANPVLDYANAMVPKAPAEHGCVRKATGRSMLTANRISLHLSGRWPRPNLPAACTLQAGTMHFRSAQLSARLWKIPLEATCKPLRPMARAQPPACWVTCSGHQNALPQETSAPRRRIPAREVWAQAQEPTTFLSQCRHCDNNRRIGICRR